MSPSLVRRPAFASLRPTDPAPSPGYLAIYLLGTATGLYVLPPDPYFYDRLQALRPKSSGAPVTAEKQKEREARMQKAWKNKPGKLASVLGSYAILWWALYGALKLAGWVVSRRLVRPLAPSVEARLTFRAQANLAYVVWVVAFNASFLFGYLLVNMWTSNGARTETSPPTPGGLLSPAASAPAIFDAVNRNSLVVFLIVSFSLAGTA